jgi:hypothetical protein
MRVGLLTLLVRINHKINVTNVLALVNKKFHVLPVYIDCENYKMAVCQDNIIVYGYGCSLEGTWKILVTEVNFEFVYKKWYTYDHTTPYRNSAEIQLRVYNEAIPDCIAFDIGNNRGGAVFRGIDIASTIYFEDIGEVPAAYNTLANELSNSCWESPGAVYMAVMKEKTMLLSWMKEKINKSLNMDASRDQNLI